ncbi:MAG TPA: RluA family pseudouridine synthase [Vicinamibacterales bacterium]|nr:RluA family pseudouridine synthase [Vicinamibacterales bacterium]
MSFMLKALFAASATREAALLDVVHEDDDILVVNKPPDLVCHPSKNGPLSSLIGRVRLYLGHDEGRLVNRIDRETSGVVLIAKHTAAAGELGKLLAGKAVFKSYLAIAHGAVALETQTISAPIGADESSIVAIKGCVRSDGAAAETVIRRLATFRIGEDAFTSLEVTPATGRKHQIRIHLAHIGHPLVGDKIYGGDDQIYLRFVRHESSDADWATLAVRNHLLHARSLSFRWRGRDWQFTAGAPVAFTEFLARATPAETAPRSPDPR